MKPDGTLTIKKPVTVLRGTAHRISRQAAMIEFDGWDSCPNTLYLPVSRLAEAPKDGARVTITISIGE